MDYLALDVSGAEVKTPALMAPDDFRTSDPSSDL